MRVTDVYVETFRGEPTGINASIRFSGCDTIMEVYREWDDPQWFVYDLAFHKDGSKGAGIADSERRYPVAPDSDIHKALEDAAWTVRDSFTPA